MIDRRMLIGTGACALVLGGCAGGPSGPAQLTISAQGGIGMNPGPDGSDRPVTVTILQLRSADAFNAADVFALQDPATALAADLVAMDQLAVSAGTSAAKTITGADGATVLGLVAGFRDPAGKTIRSVVPIVPGDSKTVAISLTSSGLSIS